MHKQNEPQLWRKVTRQRDCHCVCGQQVHFVAKMFVARFRNSVEQLCRLVMLGRSSLRVGLLLVAFVKWRVAAVTPTDGRAWRRRRCPWRTARYRGLRPARGGNGGGGHGPSIWRHRCSGQRLMVHRWGGNPRAPAAPRDAAAQAARRERAAPAASAGTGGTAGSAGRGGTGGTAARRERAAPAARPAPAAPREAAGRGGTGGTGGAAGTGGPAARPAPAAPRERAARAAEWPVRRPAPVRPRWAATAWLPAPTVSAQSTATPGITVAAMSARSITASCRAAQRRQRRLARLARRRQTAWRPATETRSRVGSTVRPDTIFVAPARTRPA